MPYQIQDNLHFLSEASKILSSSLDYNVTLANVAKLITDNIADFCMIDLLDDDGVMQRVAARAGNKKDRELANKTFNFPADPKNKGAIYEAARLERPILIKNVTKKWIKNSSKIPEEKEITKELGMRSFIFTPLKSRDKIIGVLTLISSKKDFTYSEEDVILADEIASRAGIAVDKARLYLQAQEALKTREEFMSIAAHELRTPLTIILLHLQKANSDIKKLMNKHTGMEKILELLERSEKQGFRLSKMINDLLDVSLANIGKMNLEKEKVNLNSLIEEEVERFKLHTDDMKAKIIFNNPKTQIIGNWDTIRIEQVISNLLSNALKYGKNKQVDVSISKKNGKAIITISDKGIGIKKEDLKNIFELFDRGSISNKKGAGIGLYITKEIIEAHGGKIEIESTFRKGTIFTVTLPLSS